MTATAPSSAPTTRAARPLWAILTILTAATFWTVTAEMLPSGLLPAMSGDLHVSEAAIGVLVSAWAITIAIVGIPLVRLTLRVPRATLLTATLTLTAAANLLTALAPSYAVALVGRIVAATAHGLFWAVVVSYVASVVPAARLGRALSLVLAGPTLAGLVGLPLAAFLSEHIGWRGVSGGLSAILAATAVTVWLILPRADGGGAEPAGTWDHSAPLVIGVAVGGGLVLVGHFAAFTYIAALTTDLGGLSSGTIPAVLLVLGGTGALGVVVSGYAADRFPRTAVVVTGALVALGLAVVALGHDRPAVFFAGTALWGIAIGALPPILQARVLSLTTPGFRPLAGAVVVTVLNLGVAVGATLGGATLHRGTVALPVAAVVVAAVGTAALLLLSRTAHRPATPPA